MNDDDVKFFTIQEKRKRLAEIIHEMQQLPKVETEQGHEEADDLLVQALISMAFRYGSIITQDEIKQLVEAYRAIKKWYA